MRVLIPVPVGDLYLFQCQLGFALRLDADSQYLV